MFILLVTRLDGTTFYYSNTPGDRETQNLADARRWDSIGHVGSWLEANCRWFNSRWLKVEIRPA